MKKKRMLVSLQRLEHSFDESVDLFEKLIGFTFANPPSGSFENFNAWVADGWHIIEWIKNDYKKRGLKSE